MTLHDIRNDYKQQLLDEKDVAPSPIDQFKCWFDEALAASVPDTNAMTLATATPDGNVSARIVLLKSFDENGFCFYTNYESSKGKALAANPHAALVFFWQPLERQVRIEGTVSKMSDAEADEYFQSRPVASQLGALASPQSQPIASREILKRRFDELSSEYKNKTIPRPNHWGGYRLAPTMIEFWQGRESRLHDRIAFRRLENREWKLERLAP